MSESCLSLTVESVGRDGCHIVVVTLGEKEIHRDGLFIDRADDRRRFIDDLVKRVPAITDGSEVSPDAIEARLIALASKVTKKVKAHAAPEFRAVTPGTKVRALDRDNIGNVETDNGDCCTVRFVSPDGYEAVKELPKSLLRTMDGKPLQSNIDDDDEPEPFPVDLLPPVVRQYVVEGAEARAADPCIVALPVLVLLAACIGLTRRTSPKNGWNAPAILWGAVVGRSGSLKSVGYDLAHELLKHAEDQNHRDHLTAMDNFRLAEMEHSKNVRQWSKSKDAGEPPEAPETPIAKRLVVDDTTTESLAPLLKENPRGLFLLTDELRGWFDGMGAYSSSGRSNAEARWLALFEGRAFNVDRKTNRERTYVREAGVSVAGTIQPSILERVVGDGQVESGMLARLLLVMPKPRAKKWTDAEMSETTRLAMQRVVDQLRTLEFEVVDGFPKVIVLPLTNDAKQRFIPFVDSHGVETLAQDDALAAAWSKLEGYALRFALVDHLSRWAAGDSECEAAGPVGVKSIEAGIELARWFANEAERVYRRIGVTARAREDVNERHVDRLAEWLLSKGGSATEREIARGPRRYRGEEKAIHIEADCSALIKQGRAKWDGSRKTRRIVMIDPGDDGDGDSSNELKEKSEQVSPEDRVNVTVEQATFSEVDGDTCSQNAAKNAQVSPSPESPPASSSERRKVTL